MARDLPGPCVCHVCCFPMSQREATLPEGTGKHVAKARGHGGDTCCPLGIPTPVPSSGTSRTGGAGAGGAGSFPLGPGVTCSASSRSPPGFGRRRSTSPRGRRRWPDPAALEPLPHRSRPGLGRGRERGPQDGAWARAPAGCAWSGFSGPLAARPPGAGSSSLACCRRAGDSYRGRTKLAGHLLVFCVLGIYFHMVSV